MKKCNKIERNDVSNIKESLKLTSSGFTLMELVAVIAILALLFTFATPKLMENYRDKKDKLYDATIDEIERLTSLYLSDNPEIYSDISKNGYVKININLLCIKKYLVCPIKDPKDKNNISGYVKVTYEDNKYVYKFVRE